MNPPPIQWIPVFEASAKHMSFRKAAEQLNVSPPAISQQIKSLEAYLGVDLFSRNGPRLSLTEAGELYYQVAMKVVAEHSRGFSKFDQHFNKRCLRLHTPLFIAQELLIPNYMGYKELQPKVELRMTTGTEYIDFDLGTADAAIRFGMGNWLHLESELLCPVEVAPVCSSSYYQKNCNKEAINISDLLCNQVLISADENLKDWKDFFPNIEPKEVIICDSYFSAIKSAEKGLGIVIGIFPAINSWVNDDRLTLLSNEFFKTQAGYWLVYPKQRGENALLNSCYLWSKELFKSLPKLS
jgi:LysR family glycine cleavage system transcriptional activator